MQKIILQGTNILFIQSLERLKGIIMSRFVQFMTPFLSHHPLSTDINWYLPVLPKSWEVSFNPANSKLKP